MPDEVAASRGPSAFQNLRSSRCAARPHDPAGLALVVDMVVAITSTKIPILLGHALSADARLGRSAQGAVASPPALRLRSTP